MASHEKWLEQVNSHKTNQRNSQVFHQMITKHHIYKTKITDKHKLNKGIQIFILSILNYAIIS